MVEDGCGERMYATRGGGDCSDSATTSTLPAQLGGGECTAVYLQPLAPLAPHNRACKRKHAHLIGLTSSPLTSISRNSLRRPPTNTCTQTPAHASTHNCLTHLEPLDLLLKEPDHALVHGPLGQLLGPLVQQRGHVLRTQCGGCMSVTGPFCGSWLCGLRGQVQCSAPPLGCWGHVRNLLANLCPHTNPSTTSPHLHQGLLLDEDRQHLCRLLSRSMLCPAPWHTAAGSCAWPCRHGVSKPQCQHWQKERPVPRTCFPVRMQCTVAGRGSHLVHRQGEAPHTDRQHWADACHGLQQHDHRQERC